MNRKSSQKTGKTKDSDILRLHL